ncbi:MAG TPA: Gfo/Idh/MocA family oxidoreductase [Acidimicrobiales bacterium]
MTTAPLRIAILTCGTIVSKGHLPAFAKAGRDAVDVVAFTSRTRASAESAAAEWGSGRVVTDWRDVLEMDDVDAVDICSPNALHAEMAVEAARAGKHVLVEKPMAVSLAEADAMIDAARDAGVVLMTAHNLRGAPAFVGAAEAVRSGRVGEVDGVRIAFGHSGPASWAPGATWFYDPALAGGGAGIDLGIHVADLARAVTGLEVDRVAGVVQYRDDEVDEAAHAAIELSNGATGVLSATWVARPGPDLHVTVLGRDGTVSISRGSAVVRAASGGEAQPVAAGPVDLFAGFVDACLDRAAAPFADTDGREALAIVVAMYASARTGTTVPVDHRR